MPSFLRLFLRVSLRKEGPSLSCRALFRYTLFRGHCRIVYLVKVQMMRTVDVRKVDEMGAKSVFQKSNALRL